MRGDGRTKAFQFFEAAQEAKLWELWAKLHGKSTKQADGNTKYVVTSTGESAFAKQLPMLGNGHLAWAPLNKTHQDITGIGVKGEPLLRKFIWVDRGECRLEGLWVIFDHLATGNNCGRELINMLMLVATIIIDKPTTCSSRASILGTLNTACWMPSSSSSSSRRRPPR